MVIKSFSDKVLLPSKSDVLRIHLYTKFLEFGIQPFESDIDIILQLYVLGGYKNIDEQERFFSICLEKKYRKSKQSIRNTLSKYINLGVLNKPKNTQLAISDKFIPNIQADVIVLQHITSHAVRS